MRPDLAAHISPIHNDTVDLEFNADGSRKPSQIVCIRQIDASIQGSPRNRPIHGARVEKAKTKALGKAARGRRLAGARRSR